MKLKNEIVKESQDAYEILNYLKDDDDFGKANFVSGYIKGLEFSRDFIKPINEWDDFKDLKDLE